MREQAASLRGTFRTDLPGRFSELELLGLRWPPSAATVDGWVLPPYEVLIHPSSGCDLRCLWCVGDHAPLETRDGDRDVRAPVDASAKAPDRLAEASFAEVREDAGPARVRGGLPAMRRKALDPFENRADTVVQIGRTINDTHGLDHPERDVNQLIDSRAHNRAHSRGNRT